MVAALADRARGLVSDEDVAWLLAPASELAFPDPDVAAAVARFCRRGPVILDELRDRRVAVWGLGQEGMAMVALLAARGVVPALIDDRPEAASTRIGGDRAVLAPGVVDWSAPRCGHPGPGVSRYRPELAAAGRPGWSVTTAMALWLEDFREARVVAVTGTKGKSTTAALAASILRHQGGEVALIGNIGVPVTDTYDRPRADAYVVEVSSFQAADVTVTPGVCVLTSLAPDHLDWHGGEEPYYRDKLHLIEVGPPGALAVSAASAEAVARTEGHPHRSLFGPAGLVRVGSTGIGRGRRRAGWSTRPDCGPPGPTTYGTCAGPSPGSRSCRVPRRRPMPSGRRWTPSTGCRPAATRSAGATASPSSMMPWRPIPLPPWPRWMPSPDVR